MATTIQVKKLANPHRRRVKMRSKRRNSARRTRRKMSVKQIRIFGTKAQKAALKRRRHKNPRVSANRRKRRKSSNPAPLILTLGAINPKRNKKRSNPVAKTKTNRRRRRNPVARRRNRKSNPRRVVVKNVHHYHTRRRKRRNPRVVVVSRANRRHHRRHHRRNPISTTMFGQPLFGKNSLELVGGGLLGLVAAKFIPTLFPASLTGSISGTSIGRVVISGVSAVLAGWGGSKISPQLGQGMLFGGMIQTASVALNAFLPSVYGQLNPQLGDLMPGAFSVPQNPLRLPPPPPAALPAGSQARVTMNGLARAYGSAF